MKTLYDIVKEKYGKPKQILFNTEMVQAILAGKKTQTRRLIKNQPPKEMDNDAHFCRMPMPWKDYNICYFETLKQNPFERIFWWEGKEKIRKDDILYIRETWAKLNDEGHIYYEYKADTDNSYPGEWPSKEAKGNPDAPKWKPSIHMPKEAARIFLKVTDVRIERLQSISEEDAKAEGVNGIVDVFFRPTKNGHILFFSDMWNKLYERKGYGWDTNPWVWIIEFERIEADADS